MPTASVTSPITPPRASISRTRWPLAIPPIAGLQDICAIKSRFIVIIAVRKPRRAHARAASHPAWPAPTTTTSYRDFMAFHVQCGILRFTRNEDIGSGLRRPRTRIVLEAGAEPKDVRIVCRTRESWNGAGGHLPADFGLSCSG